MLMVIVKATNDSEDGKMPTPELLEQMGAFNQQLKDAGTVEADGQGRAQGARVVRAKSFGDQGAVSTSTNSSSAIGSGKCIILNEAMEWVKRCPIPCPGRRSSKSAPFIDGGFDRSK